MITIGVDAHKRAHAAVAVDDAGRELGHWRGPNTADGWRQLGDRGGVELRARARPIPGRGGRDSPRGQRALDRGGTAIRTAARED